MSISVTFLLLASGVFAANSPPSAAMLDDARIIQTVLESPPRDVPLDGIRLDSRRFTVDAAPGTIPWSAGPSWSREVVDAVTRLRPGQVFCEESFETFDRCVVEDGKPHVVFGDIVEMPSGQISVRVLFLQRFPSIREGRDRFSLQDWEYRLEVDSEGQFRVADRKRIAIT